MKHLLVYITLAIALAVASGWNTYQGYKLCEVIPLTNEQVRYIRSLEGSKHVSLMTSVSVGQRVGVLMAPGAPSDVTERLEAMLHEWVSVERYISEQKRYIEERTHPEAQFDLDQYNTYTQIMNQLEMWRTMCASGITCETYDVGQSIESRRLTVFKLSKSGTGRRAFWSDSLIHSREWLAGATHLKILHNLVTNYTNNADVKYILDKYDWYALVVMNPDGYEYTFNNDRMWRKNRRITGGICDGIDLNRNYDSRWGYENGASEDPCSNIYKGDRVASEPETVAVQNEGLRINSTLRAWVSYHTAAVAWLTPFGNLVDDDLSNDCEKPNATIEADQLRVARVAAEATEQTNGQPYGHGNSCEVLGITTGTTKDWAHGKAGVKHTYTMELGGLTFDPPPEEIEPSYREAWNGLVAMVREIENVDGS